jgi:Fe-S-cluster containining protein
MVRQRGPTGQGASAELGELYGEADALVAGASCVCSEAKGLEDARCCHFGKIGREPYVTSIEVALVARAIAARGQSHAALGHKRRLPLSKDLRTCPLLSPAGRCTIYEARPLGCRTFFCEGHEPVEAGRVRKALLDVARRVRDLSARASPRDEGPRPFTRALADLGRRPFGGVPEVR